MMDESIKKIEKHLTEASKVLLSSVDLAPQISEIVDVAVNCLASGGTIFWCGNGGSAADSQHLAAELIGRYKMERKAISSIALTTDSSILTAISNDFGFEQVFSRQLEGLARPGDVLIALSTSGTSKSILNAIEKAKELKVVSVMMTSIKYSGVQGDHVLKVASMETEQIQHGHIAIGHIICELIEMNCAKSQ